MRSESTLFGVTANHVIEHCLAGKASSPDGVCVIQSKVIDIESRLIDCSQKLDIATIRFEEAELDELSIDALQFEESVRSIEIKDGQPIQLVGMLDGKRKVVAPLALEQEAYGALTIVESVGLEEFLVVYDPKAIEYAPIPGQLPPLGMSMSGCSGGPALLIAMRNGLVRSFPVGMIFQGPGNTPIKEKLNIDLIRIRKLSVLGPDGIICANGSGWLP